MWGQKYVDLFEKTIIRSFAWPLNKKALNNERVTWSIHTTKEDSTKVIQLCRRLDINDFNLTLLPDEMFEAGADQGLYLLRQFCNEIDLCLKENARLLIAPPDSIFGDGTLPALFKAGQQNETCVAVPHPRVLPSIFEYPSELAPSLGASLTNAQLVTEAWRNLHKTWSEAELGFEKINSYVGGVQWKKLSPNLYSVQHRLPTNYLIHFTPSDLQFFSQQISFGAIDHLWPTKLIQEQRERVVSSSDACFIVEVTDPKQNIPPCYPFNKKEPDRFWRNAPHNAFFRQVNIIFRGA